MTQELSNEELAGATLVSKSSPAFSGPGSAAPTAKGALRSVVTRDGEQATVELHVDAHGRKTIYVSEHGVLEELRARQVNSR